MPYPGAGKPWKCKCIKFGHQCAPTYTNVMKRETGCPVCAHKKAGQRRLGRPPANRLDPKGALAAMRAAGLEPKVAYPGAAKPWKSKCLKCGSDCAPRLDSVKNRGSGGCRKCANQASSERQATPHADAVAEMRAAGIEPLGRYPGARSPWKSRCMTCQRSISPKLMTVRSGSGGCTYCRHTKIGIAKRVTEDKAVQVMRNAGLEPLEPYPTSSKPWKCLCLVCNRTVTPMYLNVKRRGKGCGYCVGRLVEADEALAFMRSRGVEPQEPFPGRHTPWKCVCLTCNTKISPNYGNARKGQGLCQKCATHGMSFGAPAVVYLLCHDDFEALKVGIASQVSRTDRLEYHQFQGWKLIKVWETPTGFHAAAIEREILDWWRDELGAPVLLTKKQLPQGGHTETVSYSRVGVTETVKKIRRAVAVANRNPHAYVASEHETALLMTDG